MAAKILAQLLLPLNVTIELLLLATLLRWRGKRRTARACAVLAVLVLWGAATPPVSWWLLRTLEDDFSPVAVAESPTAEAIVVLGGAVRPVSAPALEVDLSGASDRVLHTARLYRAGKAPLVIASGGSFLVDRAPESPAVADLLVEWGVPRESIVIEDRSGTTRENAERTAALLKERGLARVLLVTSAAHMGRALGAFRAVGIDAHPSPTDYQIRDQDTILMDWLPEAGALEKTHDAVREWLGRAWYRLRGWAE